MSQQDTHSDHAIEPWYRQFWPWFLISIVGLGVVLGLATVVIATQNPPQLTQHDIGRFAQVEDTATTEPPAASLINE